MKTKALLIVFILLVFLVQNLFSQGWVSQSSGVTTTLRQVVFYNAQTGWAVGDGGKILKTTNGGGNWNALNSGTTQDLYSIAINDSTTLFACGNGGVIIKTTNSGTSWTAQTSGTTAKLKYLYKYTNNTYYVSGENGTLIGTNNGGSLWFAYNSNTTEHLNCIYFEDQTTGYVYGNNGTIRSNGFGGPWAVVTFPSNENILGCSGFGTYAALCTGSGNIYSIVGTYMVNTGVNTSINSMDSKGSGGYPQNFPKKMWCAGDNGVIRYSSDTGHTWLGQNSLTTSNLYSIFMLDSLRGWFVGANGTISSTTTGGVIGITPISTEVPAGFSLSQNYPNPFNPNSKIKFSIPNKGLQPLVRIKVFDILGREVTTLVNEQLKPGTYEVDFDGTKLTSGVYFYRLIAGDDSETKKMILIK